MKLYGSISLAMRTIFFLVQLHSVARAGVAAALKAAVS